MNFLAAEKEYKKALTINPLSSDTYYNLADLYHRTGKYEKAENNYSAALKITPNDKQILLELRKVKKLLFDKHRAYL